jgi:hypothetical protein
VSQGGLPHGVSERITFVHSIVLCSAHCISCRPVCGASCGFLIIIPNFKATCLPNSTYITVRSVSADPLYSLFLCIIDYVERKQKPKKSNPTYQVMTVGIGFVGEATKHFENSGITMERVFKLRNLKLLMDEHTRRTFVDANNEPCWSQWPRCLRRWSAAARLLTLWVRIPPEAGKLVTCDCCVLSGGSLCGELITRPEESYRLW